jgi:23S rRNA (guanosine2251-2'-O)-methyltransferase
VRSRAPQRGSGRHPDRRAASRGGAATGRELLVGVHPVREALRARRRILYRLCVRQPESAKAPASLRPELAGLWHEAERAGVPVDAVPPAVFDHAAPVGVPHQGVLLEAGPLPRPRWEELIPGPGAPGWLVACDGVEDPQNLGAILRVADAAGAVGALLPERRAAPLSAAVGRASAGALEHVPVAPVTNLSRTLERLKEQGFWVHGADPEAELTLFEAPDRLFAERMVLVVGAEGRGLRPGIRAALDVSYRIAMRGSVASLNVATAAAVVLFEWRRRADAARPAGPPR